MSARALEVPEHRRAGLRALLAAIEPLERVVLTTHVNADGDGAGSQAAIAAWLSALGKQVHIANPTAFPALYLHLLETPELLRDPAHPETARTIREADALFVLDTSEPRRIGRVAGLAAGRPVLVLDHHVVPERGFEGVNLQDPGACATGELVYDLLCTAGWERPWPAAAIHGIYTALVTDTGSFRFANTTRRAHELAGDLIEQGVDPEREYRRIFATVPLHRVQLLRHALDNLEVDAQYPLTWISIDRGVMEELGATVEDLEGLVEHARSIEGTEVALLFRSTTDGGTKVSLRSAGDVDVNAIAREFGGGGHVKASGAVLPDPLPRARERVLAAARAALAASGLAFRALAGPA
jgi:phosphoesterase RecJ-like protein